jgi:hypothetical protein
MAERPRQRARFSKSDGLPFDVITDPSGTGLVAVWRPDGTLEALRYHVNGEPLVDAMGLREIRFVSDTCVESYSGEQWSDGVEHDSYAAAFEDYSPRTIELVPWVRSQLANIDDPTRAEIERARARRTRWSALLSLAALTGITVAWFTTGPKNGLTIGLSFAGLCLGVPALWYLPHAKAIEVRGHVVPEPRD